MKKVSLIVLSLTITTLAVAQHLPRLGIKGGLNVSTLKVANINQDAIDPRIGYHLGLFAHVHTNHPSWAIQPEIQYSSEGMKLNDNGDQTTWKLNYINIPVMVQYMFDNGFRLEAGPQLGLLANSVIEDEQGNDDNADDLLKSTNFSLGIGANYLSYSGLGVGARYNHGLSEINKGRNDISTRTFQISLFYMFDHQHKAKSR